MTEVYFVRHSKILYTHDDYSRPLSEEGRKFVPLVTEAFKDIPLDVIASSPYIRVIDTIKGVADMKDLEIELYDDLRERKVSNVFIDDFHTFTLNQWNDFDFKLEGGESINEVQKRGSRTLEWILEKYAGKKILVGTHGTFMSVLLNYYDSAIDFEFWRHVRMPDIYKASFVSDAKGCRMTGLENVPLGTLGQ